MRKSILGTLTVGFGVAMWLAACGGDNGSTGSGGSTGASTSVSSSTGTAGGGAASGACTEVTVTSVVRSAYSKMIGDSIYRLNLGTMLGGVGADSAQLEFYDLSVTGTKDLSAEPDDNYATCTTCVRVFEDIDPATGKSAKTYYQQSGTLELGSTKQPAIAGSFKDVTLIEVTIHPNDFDSTPVEGGTCLHITNAEFKFDVAPAEYTCDPGTYGDRLSCDCGPCGVSDPDCTDPMLPIAGCAEGQTCATGLKCEGVPSAWTCDPAKYNGGMGNGCDCACGSPDPDCDLMGEMVAGCMMTEKCAEALCVPKAWTCKASSFKDGVCTCGCGALDGDCADATVASCKFCDDVGSCNTAACPGTINPTNNAICN